MPNFLLREEIHFLRFLVEMGSSKIDAHLWVDICIYEIGRKRCTRVKGCSSAIEVSDMPYMDRNAYGSITHVVPYIYYTGTARSLHIKGIGIDGLHIPRDLTRRHGSQQTR